MPSAPVTSAAPRASSPSPYGEDSWVANHRILPNPARGTALRKPHWTAEDRSLALWLYGETGSFAQASRQSGVPASTIKGWIEHDEDGSIAQEIDDLRLAVRQVNAGKCAYWASKAIDECGRALTEGDEVMDRHGRVHHLKIKGKDAAWIASILIDKHALLTGMASQRQVGNALTAVADKLLGMVESKLASYQPATPPPLDPSALG